MDEEHKCENCGGSIEDYKHFEYIHPIEIDDLTEEFLLPFIDKWVAEIERELDSLNFALPEGYSYSTMEKLRKANLKLRDFFAFDILDKLSDIERIDMKNIDKLIWNARSKIMDMIFDDPIRDIMWSDGRSYKEIFKEVVVCDKCKHLYWHVEEDYLEIKKIQDVGLERAIKIMGGCKQYFSFLAHKDAEIKTYWSNRLKIQFGIGIVTSKRFSNIKKLEVIEEEISELKRNTIYSILKAFDNVERSETKQIFGKIINFIELRKRVDNINLVSGDSISFDARKSYSDIELDTESDTHKHMRETSINYFLKEGYDVCPETIGVTGTYTLADFAITKNKELIFVECLTDRSSTKEVIERKMNLKKYGNICFIFVGGSGYSDFWVDDTHQLPDIVHNISDDVPIYLYYYGHWKNDFEKRIEEYHKLLTPEDNEICKKVEIKFDIEVKRKYCYIKMNVPLQIKNKNRNYILPFKMIYNKSDFLKYRVGRKITIGQPMNFKIENNEGINHFKNYIEELSAYFTVIYNKDKIDEFKIKVENLPEQNKNKLTIKSNMPIEDRIVWVLYRLFENKPTSISKLSDVIGIDNSGIQYYLSKGIKGGNLFRVCRGQYIATDKGIEEIECNLNKEHEVLVVHPKHGSYWTRHRYYIGYGNITEGCIEND